MYVCRRSKIEFKIMKLLLSVKMYLIFYNIIFLWVKYLRLIVIYNVMNNIST